MATCHHKETIMGILILEGRMLAKIDADDDWDSLLDDEVQGYDPYNHQGGSSDRDDDDFPSYPRRHRPLSFD